ncbi:hypothetical protein KAJ27_00790 [bacterium]|nr:hypothetical protein [bacterium]
MDAEKSEKEKYFTMKIMKDMKKKIISHKGTKAQRKKKNAEEKIRQD